MENINEKVGAANTTYVGVGHGLQLRYGPHSGRLVIRIFSKFIPFSLFL